MSYFVKTGETNRVKGKRSKHKEMLVVFQVVGSHLTEKSIGRIDHVFDFFTDASFMEEVFKKDSKHRPILKSIIDDMHKAMEAGEL